MSGTRALRGLLSRWTAIVLAALAAGGAQANEALWSMLREGGYAVLIRHAATEPGLGDPPNFRLGDSFTKRNLSAEGRAEARRLADAFRERKVPVERVLSSAWCRCQDTARLAFGRRPCLHTRRGTTGTTNGAASETHEVLPHHEHLLPGRDRPSDASPTASVCRMRTADT